MDPFIPDEERWVNISSFPPSLAELIFLDSCRPSPTCPDCCHSVSLMLWKDLWPKTWVWRPRAFIMHSAPFYWIYFYNRWEDICIRFMFLYIFFFFLSWLESSRKNAARCHQVTRKLSPQTLTRSCTQLQETWESTMMIMVSVCCRLPPGNI